MELNEQNLPAVTPIDTIADAELSGAINRSVEQGAKFELLLAMLQQDVTRRPQVQAEQAALHPSDLPVSLYRNPPLQTSQQDIKHLHTTSRMVSSSSSDALLWQAMHPQPLSLFNDPERLADEVVYNCAYHTQQQLKAPVSAEIETDETGLYDILESLPSQ